MLRFARMRVRSMWSGIALAVCMSSAPAFAGGIVTFAPPHHVRAPRGVLSGSLQKQLDDRLALARPRDAGEALRWALGVSDGAFHFGLGHATSRRLTANEREGNCIEYSELFALAFNRAAERAKLAGRAYIVQSATADKENGPAFCEAVSVRG